MSVLAGKLKTVNDPVKFRPPDTQVFTGEEPFKGLEGVKDSHLKDFWAYAARDLRSNVLRGNLAEWLVAKAIGDAAELQPVWSEFDVLMPPDIRVEVKSSAYLQAWPQRKPSTIQFSGLRSKKLRPDGRYEDQRTFNAHVYVFCVQTAESHESYDPLDVSQWAFYVLPRSRVESIDQGSIGLTRIKDEGAQQVGFDGLAAAIDQAAENPARDPRE